MSAADEFPVGGFAERLVAAIGERKQAMIAKRADISTTAMSKYVRGESEPGLQAAARLSRALGVSIWWLVTGEGQPNAAAGGYLSVPIYDVRLAAGAASFAEGAKVLGDMPFDRELLRQLGRTSAEGLAILESEGDSMEPTIPDGARVLVDLKDVRLREGVFGFRFDDELRVKRLRRAGDGVEVISDNPRYRSELVEGSDLERFSIIGRVHWVGAVL